MHLAQRADQVAVLYWLEVAPRSAAGRVTFYYFDALAVPFIQSLPVALASIESLTDLEEFQAVLGEDYANMNNVFLVEYVVKISILFHLHPHAALAFVSRDMAVAIEIYRIPF